MTKYLFGECDSKIAEVDPNDNSFEPAFQHEFDENYPSTIVRLKRKINGEVKYWLYDLSISRFIGEAKTGTISVDLDTEKLFRTKKNQL